MLDISYNNISTLPEQIVSSSWLYQIQHLTMSYLPLIELDTSTSGALSSLAMLEYLDLSHCGLRHLPTSLMINMTSLNTLDLTGNNFVEIDDSLRLARSLKILILDDNNFEYLNKNSFPGTNYLEYLSVRYLSNEPNILFSSKLYF